LISKTMRKLNGKSVFSYLIRITYAFVLTFLFNASAAEKPAIESFFNNPAMQQVTISPDGKVVAMLVPAPKTGYLQLVTLNLENMGVKMIAGFTNADIGSYDWVNNKRLVYSAAFHDTEQGNLRYYPGLYAVNLDGSERMELASPVPGEPMTTGSNIQSRKLTGYTWLAATDHSNQSDDVFVGQPVYDNLNDVKAMRLLRLNTKTGKSTLYQRPGNSTAWVIDQNGTPRINTTLEKGIETVYYLDPANSEWRKLAEFSQFDPHSFTPLAFSPDGSLYVTSNAGKNFSALYRYDLAKNALDPTPVVNLSGYDFTGSLVFDKTNKRIAGVHYLTDANSSVWLDPGFNAIQKKIDEKLPTTINRLSVSSQHSNPYIVVTAFSDIQPPLYFLYNQSNEKFIEIGKEYPDIQANEMSRQDFIHYQAKDGLSIPAYLSLPKGRSKKNLPLIVLVHGGPYVRGSEWGWDPQVQFLTSRGYAVLQPEFRGSTGFGAKHFEAGFKQWGLKMQEDLADGARWAIAQGYADPKRICIAGASYGGYATLMGLAKNPELFRCGFEWVGVTDIHLMFEASWENDASEEWQKYGMPVMIGDRIKDAAQLKATSPVNIAAQIKQPLLMAYGGADKRVPIAHGKKFRDAIADTNKQVEWIQYNDEGHGWKLVKNRLDFWSRVEKFLEKNLAPE